MSSKLQGQELLDYVAANSGLDEKELVTGAGFFTEITDKDGQPRSQVHIKAFYQELALAKGLIDPSTAGRTEKNGRPGKSLSYCLRSNPNTGNVVLTRGYIEQIGVTGGDRVTVEVIQETGEIVLKRFAPTETVECGLVEELAEDGEMEEEESSIPAYV
jgi:hypothetical protein